MPLTGTQLTASATRSTASDARAAAARTASIESARYRWMQVSSSGMYLPAAGAKAAGKT